MPDAARHRHATLIHSTTAGRDPEIERTDVPLFGRTGLVRACAASGGGVSYRRVHQAWMITSWVRLVSVV
jgi:hypothetical protein